MCLTPQAEIRQMHASLFDKRSVLLQALNEASGQSIAVQLQVTTVTPILL